MARLEGALVEQYRIYHAKMAVQYRGGMIKRLADDVTAILEQIPTTSILDYGCGKGTQYTEEHIHEPWGVMPTLFDPGVPGLEELPEKEFDGVICTGVLEHIPQRELNGTFANLVRYARKWCFINVGVSVSKKHLPNGMPVHVTLESSQWWANRILRAFTNSPAAVWFSTDRPRPITVYRLR